MFLAMFARALTCPCPDPDESSLRTLVCCYDLCQYPPSTPRSSKWYLFLRFPHRNLLFIFLLSLRLPHASPIAHSFCCSTWHYLVTSTNPLSISFAVFFIIIIIIIIIIVVVLISPSQAQSETKHRYINNIKVGLEGKVCVDVKWIELLCNLPGINSELKWTRW